LDKVWKSRKRCYFCTRIQAQVHTHTDIARHLKTNGISLTGKQNVKKGEAQKKVKKRFA
jgi:hypothetical protein